MMQERICFAALFIVEGMIAWVYLDHLFARKRKLWFHIASFALAYILLFGISQFDNIALNSVSFALTNFYLIWLDYRCKFRTAVVHAAFLCFIMLAAEILVSLVINWFGYGFSEYTHNFTIMLALVIWSKLLYLFLSSIGARIFSSHKQDTNEPGAMILFCVLPMASVVVAVITIYVGMRVQIDQTVGIMMVTNVGMLLVMNLLFLAIYNHMKKMNTEHTVYQVGVQKEQANIAHYAVLKEKYDNQRILVHDIKNHLHIIDGMAKQQDTEKISEYISELDASLRLQTPAYLCNNPVLNILLVEWSEKCNQHGIDFQLDIRDNSMAFMDAPGITMLFSNLLSNAFEAASKSEQRCIELSVRNSVDRLAYVVTLVNSCDIAPILDTDGKLVSQKKDSTLHGTGMISVQKVVDRYKGLSTMRYDPDLRQFHYIIYFPMQ